MEVISELKDEIEHTYENLCEQALEHIHTGEIILTYGASTAAELFLKRAAQKRSFQVVIAEGEPGRMRNDGHEMAKRLADDGLTVTLIPNTSVFAIMARVNKVLLPTHAVMADGGIVSFPGTHVVALAAKEFSLPVVCLAALHQVCACLCPPLPFLWHRLLVLCVGTPAFLGLLFSVRSRLFSCTTKHFC
jgi:translation initiation factor eIF-2B subunit beta